MLAESSTNLVPFIAAGGVGVVGVSFLVIRRSRRSTSQAPDASKVAEVLVTDRDDATNVATPVATEVAPHVEAPNVREPLVVHGHYL